MLRDLGELRKICDRVHHISESDIPPVIVVSALYGVTNRLEELIEAGKRKEIADYLASRFQLGAERERETGRILLKLGEMLGSDDFDLREHRDEIMSYGEKVTAAVLTEMLTKSGTDAVSIDASSLIRVDGSGPNVDIAETGRLLRLVTEAVKQGHTVVIPGFYGSDSKGKTVLLGRGGSDFTAGIVASCIAADTLEFWKDVDGIMSADPRFVDNPVRFRNISSGMAKEISMLGGKILHPQALKLLDFSKCRVVIKNVRKPSDFGTIVGIRNSRAASIVMKTDLVLVTWNVESSSDGNLMRLLSSILEAGAKPYSVSATGATVLTIYDTSDFTGIEQDLRDIAISHIARMKVEKPLSMISVICDLPSFSMRKMRADILSSLYGIDIFEKAVITLNPTLSFGIVVERYDSQEAVNLIHNAVVSAEMP